MASTKVRTVLDATTTGAVLLTCVIVIMSTLGARRSARSHPEPPLPADPVSILDTKTAGRPHAAVAVIEYSDFQCPYCGYFARDVWPELEREYVQTGRVLFAFRHFPLQRIHPLAVRAAEAAECAGEQGRFWDMKSALFADRTSPGDAHLYTLATALILDQDEFRECMDSGRGVGRIRGDVESGTDLSVSATPSFLIGYHERDSVRVTHRLRGRQDIAKFRAILDSLLTR